MKVKCIDNIKNKLNGEGTYEINACIGKIYTVIHEDDEYYRLKGRKGYYNKKRFEKIEVAIKKHIVK